MVGDERTTAAGRDDYPGIYFFDDDGRSARPSKDALLFVRSPTSFFSFCT